MQRTNKNRASAALLLLIGSASPMAISSSGCSAPPVDEPLEGPLEASAGEDDEPVAEAAAELSKSCNRGEKRCGFDEEGWAICCLASEVCSPDGGCAEPPPPVRLERGVMTVKYKVLGVLYAPPGKRSEVRYGSTSSLGSRTEISSAFQVGASVTLKTPVLDVETDWKYTNVTSRGFEQRKSTTTTSGLVSKPERASDELEPGEDLFYIWYNPMFDVQEVSPGSYTITPGAVGGQRKVLWITADEIRDPTKRNAALALRVQESGLSEEDLSTILTVDPVASGAALHPDRFVYVDTITLKGAPGGTALVQEVGITNESITSQLRKHTFDHSASIKIGPELHFFGVYALRFGASFAWTYDNISQTTAAQKQEAVAKFATDTPNIYQDYEVLYDSSFGTFAFRKIVPAPGAQAVSGQILGQDGAALANAVVKMRLPDGRVRSVLTDERGVYEVRGVAPGGVELYVTGRTERGTVSPHAPLELHARAGAR